MMDFRKTKIIGTIGPASESAEMLEKLMKEGLNVCRINFSHGGYEDNEVKIQTIKEVREKLGYPIAIALDNKGPEIRTGKLAIDGKETITEGQEFRFVVEDILGTNEKTAISYKELYKDVKPGTRILVDDGALELEVKKIEGTDIVTVAKNTAQLGSRKTVNVLGVKLNLPALSEKDIKDLKDGIKAGFNYIFASFVRRADDVNQIRAVLNENGGQHMSIIAKIESQEGIDNIDEIIALADGVMVARGDLGVEIPQEMVPIAQKMIIKKCNEAGKPVITATQMLETMQSNPRPTRAEVSDVANAVYDLTGCIMLSGECAIGKYPVECVKTMKEISLAVENDVNYWKRFENRATENSKADMIKQIAYMTAASARNSNADAIVAYTKTGATANFLSSMRPKTPIIAITDSKDTYNKLALVQGVMPRYVETKSTIDEMISNGIEELKNDNIISKDDVIIIAGGSKVAKLDNSSSIVCGIMKI